MCVCRFCGRYMQGDSCLYCGWPDNDKTVSIVFSRYSENSVPVTGIQPGRRITEPSLGLLYRETDGGYSLISHGICEDEYVVIPSVYNGRPVVKIGKGVFSGCRSMRSVDIPNTVTSIDEGAFDDCLLLKSMYIADFASWFMIDFANSLSNPMQYLDNIYLVNESDNFYGELTIPYGMTQIKKFAFYGCKILNGIHIPDSVTAIGDEAFRNCSALKTIYIKDFESWCRIAFKDEWSNPMIYAENIYTVDRLTKFDGMLTIPEGVTQIKKFAFCGFKILRRVVFSEGVTSIKEKAFCGCIHLNSVVIPASLKDIGVDAFLRCDSLKSVYCKGDEPKYESYFSPYGYYEKSAWPLSATVYLYSENKPLKGGNFWHYVNGEPTIWKV